MGNTAALFGTGLGLAAASGLNAYAVLLVYGGLSRIFPEAFPGPIAQLLGTTPALFVAGVLFLLEFFADKVPVLDHVWHLLHTVVRPLVGALLAIAAVAPEDSATMNVIAGGGGGVVAMLAHLVKSATRLTSTALTGGVANVALSLAEDILAFLQSLVAIFLPMVALAVVVGLGVLFLANVPRIARSVNLFGRRGGKGPDPAAP